jgi:redox-sensitive bicupin YhaK (pirin superfamily)
LWVNLPAKYKLTPPKYQPILKEDIKTVQMNDDSGSIRIIAGNFDKVQGPATTFTPIDVWDISIKKLMKFSIPEEKTTIIFVRKGSVKICGEHVIQSPNIVLLSSKGEGITLEPMTDDETFVLLLSGDPINEPIAARGPFVMNTEKEIYQAMSDFQSGKF